MATTNPIAAEANTNSASASTPASTAMAATTSDGKTVATKIATKALVTAPKATTCSSAAEPSTNLAAAPVSIPAPASAVSGAKTPTIITATKALVTAPNAITTPHPTEPSSDSAPVPAQAPATTTVAAVAPAVGMTAPIIPATTSAVTEMAPVVTKTAPTAVTTTALVATTSSTVTATTPTVSTATSKETAPTPVVTAPAMAATAPVAAKTAPVMAKMAPTVAVTPPAAATKAPPVTAMTPTLAVTAPTAATKTPSLAPTAPAVVVTAPAATTKASAVTVMAPSVAVTVPTAATPTPVVAKIAPVAAATAPAAATITKLPPTAVAIKTLPAIPKGAPAPPSAPPDIATMHTKSESDKIAESKQAVVKSETAKQVPNPLIIVKQLECKDEKLKLPSSMLSSETISLTNMALNIGPALSKSRLNTKDDVHMVTFYKDQIFIDHRSLKDKDKDGKDLTGKKQKVSSKTTKKPTVDVPRYLIESRSPGCRLQVLLAQLEAAQRKKERLKQGRSPGAPPPGTIKLKKSTTTSSHPNVEQKPADSKASVPSTSASTAKSDTEGLKKDATDHIPAPEVKLTSVSAPLPTTTATTKTAESSKSQPTTSKGPSSSESANSCPALSLAVDPKKSEFTTKGGHTTHLLLNESDVRYAIKVKSSNNQFLRVNPVYSFLDAGTMTDLEVIRLPGGVPKTDKLLVCYVVATEDDTNPKKCFTLKAKVQTVTIAVVTRKK